MRTYALQSRGRGSGVQKTQASAGFLNGHGAGMDKPVGFLESELERAMAARALAPGDGNVVPMSATLRSQATLRERERRFRELLDALPAAVYTTDAEGRITYYNDTAAELWGHRPTLGFSEWCGSWKLFWPDGTPLPHDECPMAIALKEDRAVRGLEAACERPDGTRVPFIPYPTPLHDESGRLVGAVNMLVDITERKRAEEQQALLVRELHHRVRNTLATVQAIMGSTARSADTIEEFKTALIGRISALAKTHRLLTEEIAAVAFGDLLHNELDAFDDGSDGRITLNGPEVYLSSNLAVSLGMAVHELTTNAAKYGSLSVVGGKVDVTWSTTIEATRRTLDFDWVESSGPAVTPPKRQGFGSRLLEFVLPGQIQATASIDYQRDGVQMHCSVPMPLEAQS
ncbi:MAG: PAS domain S-box protein [Pseudolabrys sp.]|nr:PAS domain S-box protein [Pseudolabrys sp.]